MKKLNGIIAGFAFFIAIYLIGAFIEIDFNIATWTEPARILVGLLGGGCGITIALVYYGYHYEEKITK